jgi:hypothetical protein
VIKSSWRKSAEIHAIKNIRVVDGDTIQADILLPFDTTIQRRIRLKDWWADELEGAWAVEGMRAKMRLESFLEGKAVWLLSPSCRVDKYGRVIGTLMHEERIICAQEVLGELQLTAAVHKARRDGQRAQGAAGGQSHVLQTGMTDREFSRLAAQAAKS